MNLKYIQLWFLISMLFLQPLLLQGQENILPGWRAVEVSSLSAEQALVEELSRADIEGILAFSTAEVYFNTYTDVSYQKLSKIAQHSLDDPRWTPYLFKVFALFKGPHTGMFRIYIPESEWKAAKEIVSEYHVSSSDTLHIAANMRWAMVVLIVASLLALFGYIRSRSLSVYLPLLILMAVGVNFELWTGLFMITGAFWLGVWLFGVEERFSRQLSAPAWWRFRKRPVFRLFLPFIKREFLRRPTVLPGLASLVTGVIRGIVFEQSQLLLVLMFIGLLALVLPLPFIIRLLIWRYREHMPFGYYNLVAQPMTLTRAGAAVGLFFSMVLVILFFSTNVFRAPETDTERTLNMLEVVENQVDGFIQNPAGLAPVDLEDGVNISSQELFANAFFQQWYLYGVKYEEIALGYELNLPRFTLGDQGYEYHTEYLDSFDEGWFQYARNIVSSNSLNPGNLILNGDGFIRVVLPGNLRVYSLLNLPSIWLVILFSLLWLPFFWQLVGLLPRMPLGLQRSLVGNVRI